MEDADLLAAYRATTWLVQTPAGDCEVRLFSETPDLRGTGIITAYNPASVLRTAAENDAANDRLRDELLAAGVRILPVLARGTGPAAEQWDEPGFAARGLRRGKLIALGQRYGQNAVLWIDAGGQPWLVVTRAGFCGLPIGATVQDPLSPADHARTTPHEP